jgi:spoIIIJ-associated protein
MTDKIESQGKTVQDAVNEALLRMGARKDEVRIEVLEKPRSGLFGILGSKSAKVLVTRKQTRSNQNRRDFRQGDTDAVAHDLSEKGGNREERSRGRGGRNRRGGRGARTENSEARGNERNDGRIDNRSDNRSDSRNNSRGNERNTERNEAQRGDQQERGGRRRRPERSDRPERSERTERHDETSAAPREERSDRGSSRSRSRRGRGRRNDEPNTRQAETGAAQVEAGNGQENRRDGGQQERGERRDRRPGRSRSRSRRNTNQGDRPERVETQAPANQNEQSRGTLNEALRNEARNEARNENRRDFPKDTPRRNERDNQAPQSREMPRAAEVERDMTPDEIILTGIKATKYADPLRNVAEADIDGVMTDLTNGLLIRAGFPIRCEVKPGEYRQVKIVTDDSSAGMLIGRHGSTVDSIEHLVERMVSMAAGDRVRMNLDINNYRRRREESLHERAVEAANQVLENGRTYHMEPMSPRERRIVHLHVEGLEGVRTFTMGGAGGKHVVLAPDNGEDDGKSRGRDDEETGTLAADGLPELDETFEEFDDGPQPETNDLVVDDDTPPPLI